MAKNNYRQIHVYLTEQSGGRVTIEALVKPVGSQWHRRHRVWGHTYRISDFPLSTQRAYRLLAADLLREAGDPESLDQ